MGAARWGGGINPRAFATREGAKRIGLGAGLATGVDLVDQSLRIADGKQDSISFGELAFAGLSGGLAVPVVGVMPGLARALSVYGLASAYDAAQEGATLTATFRATISLFGPGVLSKLSNVGSGVRQNQLSAYPNNPIRR